MMNTEQLTEKMIELAEVRRQIKALQELEDSLKAELTAEMIAQETDTLTAGGYKAMNKTVKSSRFDSKAFKAEHEDLYKAYTKTGFQTRFTFS